LASAPPERDSTGGDAEPELGGAVGLLLPLDADLGEEVGAGGSRLVHGGVAGVAVVVRPRGAHEHRRARLGLVERADEAVRALDARSPDEGLYLVVPALADGLAGEVDDGVAPDQHLRRPFARHRGHVVTALAQLGTEAAADQAGGPGDGDLHDADPRWLIECP
jgi:hypothetical protein